MSPEWHNPLCETRPYILGADEMAAHQAYRTEMNYFAIIKNAPPPGNNVSGLYRFAEMDVGDAFDAPRDMGTKPNGTDRRMAAVSSAAYNWAKRHNPEAKFHVWCLDDNTVRCRRMK